MLYYIKGDKLMTEILNKLYDDIYYFRATKRFVDDVDTVYGCIENFSREKAIVCVNYYLQKYQIVLSAIGAQCGGVKLVYNNSIYNKKTDIDLMDDLVFCIWGILCTAHIYIGLCKNVDDFVLRYLSAQ